MLAHMEGGTMEEFDTVKLVTDEYEDLGLRKGAVGTIIDIVDVPTVPRPGYTVEFHDVPSDNLEKVKTFELSEIALVTKCSAHR
ncbi:MAG: hypothetical protein OXF52_03935 [Candidatus Dadabacteria bacterium]|nr:hypothetical protein [Candidatus Dadabacteria bacterium]